MGKHHQFCQAMVCPQRAPKQRRFNGCRREISAGMSTNTISNKPNTRGFIPADSIFIVLVAITRVGRGGEFNQWQVTKAQR